MEDSTRYPDPEGGFDVQLPPGWSAEPDPEEGGVELWGPDEVGTLHLLGFAREGDFPDPAEELYAFLEEQGIELEEDEVEDVELAGGAEMALCEYIAEDEETAESTFWLMGVAAAPGRLVFATYSCPAGEEQKEHEIVWDLLASLRLRDSG